MARNENATQAAPVTPTTSAWVVYPGPHSQIVLRSVPDVGDITLLRGKPRELPAAAAKDLITRKKVRASKDPANKDEAPGAPAQTS